MLAAAGVAAVFVTKFTEHIKTAFDLHGSQAKRNLVALIAHGTGVALAFGFGLAAFNDLLGADAGVTPVLWVDKLFTGLAIGAGAGFISDLAGR